jgi:hypothetical protein
MKQTKEDLVKQNAAYYNANESLKRDDEAIRAELGKLLGVVDTSQYLYGTQRDRVPSWYEICYLIGELKSDANYSCLIEARESLKREIADIYQRLEENGIQLPPRKL